MFHRIKKASSFVRNVQALCRDRKKPCPIYCTILAICSARSQVHQEMRDQKKNLLAVLCGKTESNCYLHSNSVTEPPPGRPHRTHTQFAQILNCESASRYFFGRRRGIAYGCVGADSPHTMYPVHQSYPRQVAERQTNIWNGFLSVSNHSVHSAVQGSSTPFQGE